MAYAIITYLGRYTGLGVGEDVLDLPAPEGKAWVDLSWGGKLDYIALRRHHNH